MHYYLSGFFFFYKCLCVFSCLCVHVYSCLARTCRLEKGCWVSSMITVSLRQDPQIWVHIFSAGPEASKPQWSFCLHSSQSWALRCVARCLTCLMDAGIWTPVLMIVQQVLLMAEPSLSPRSEVFRCAFIKSRIHPSVPVFWSVLLGKLVNVCQMFFFIFWDDHVNFSLYFTDKNCWIFRC